MRGSGVFIFLFLFFGVFSGWLWIDILIGNTDAIIKSEVPAIIYVTFIVSVLGLTWQLTGRKIYLSRIEEGKNRQAIIKKEKEQRELEKISVLERKYGAITKKIDNSEYDNIYAFEECAIVVIGDESYRFSDILSCHLDNNKVILEQASVTKTSSGSMIGRAIVGGVLTGGVGAVVGAATAKKTTLQNSPTFRNNFTVVLTTDSIKSPLKRIIFGDAEHQAREAYSLFCVIVEHNNRIKYEK